MAVGQLATSADELCKEVTQGAREMMQASLPGLVPSNVGLVAQSVVDVIRA